MPAKVRHEGSRAWIDYASDIDESVHEGLSHICRIADVLTYYGVDADIDWLMGVSGEAFCYYYHPDGTSLTPFVHSWDSALAALEASGFDGTWDYQETDDIRPTLDTIKEEIEAGRPVIAPGIKASKNGINSRCHYWFVVNGVDTERQEVSLLEKGGKTDSFAPLPYGDSERHPCWYGITRTADGADSHYGPAGKDCPHLLVRGPKHEVDRSKLIRQAIRRAVRIARERPVKLKKYGGGEYMAGLAALDRLLGDLEASEGDGIDEYKRLNPVRDDPFGGVHEELVHLNLLAKRRSAAAAFLRQARKHVTKDLRPALTAVAKKYEDVAGLALTAFEFRHGPAKEFDRVCELGRTEAHGDDVPEWADYWKRADENLADAEKRKKLIELIQQLVNAERAAVAELKKAAGRWEGK